MLPGGKKTPGKAPGFAAVWAAGFLPLWNRGTALLLLHCCSCLLLSCFHCAPRMEKGGDLLPVGCLGNKEVSMSWQFVCTSCYMLGVGLRAGADVLKRKWAIRSCPCCTIHCMCTGCLVSYGSCPEIVGTGDSESMEPYTQEGPCCSLFEWGTVML